MSLKILAAIVFTALPFSTGREVRAEEISLGFQASPPKERLSPLGEPATLALTATSSDGRPIAEGWLAVRLDAPPPGRFFSTDFPLVEGSRLLEMRLPLVNGKAEWRQVFPIRGEYRLAAEFTGAKGGKRKAVFNFHVYEDNRKWLGLGGFALGLFLTGVIAGRIFSAPRDGARKLILLLLLFFAWGAAAGEWAWARQEQTQKYISKLEISAAAVGAPARIQWWLHPAGVSGEPSATLTLTIAHSEINRVIFALEKISVAGEFALDYQFTDGAEHRVVAAAETGDGETVRQERTVSVSAAAPPLGAKLPPLILFIAVIAAGVVVGRCSRGIGKSKLPS